MIKSTTAPVADTPVLLSEFSDGVLTLTMNRAEVRNAFDDTMIAALTDSFNHAQTDPRIRAILLRGSGKFFCAGADLGWMKRAVTYTYEENIKDAEALAGLLNALSGSLKPTIALVQGGAFGGGVGLLAACDVVIAEETALFSLSEVRLGLIPAVISPYVTSTIGLKTTKRLTLTGERFNATDAHRLGLVDHVTTEEGELAAKGEAVVAEILKGAPSAHQAAKTLFRSLNGRPIDEKTRSETAAAIARQRTAPEGQEGVRAFFEKRQPSWINEI